jgi:putative isomerase
MFHPPAGVLEHPYIVPGSQAYSDCLWDWDSWLTNIALRQILLEGGDEQATEQAQPFERGCIQNFLANCAGISGWMPICITPKNRPVPPTEPYSQNMHKPCLAQHAAFLVKLAGGEAEWLRDGDGFSRLQAFVNAYRNHHRHRSGLYYWQTDFAIGVDTDPCTFFRPPGSSGSIYLNCLMYKELEALIYLCSRLGLDEVADNYRHDLADLHRAAQEHCWDERDGFFYSVDLNLLPVDHQQWLHQGMPRDYDCLIQRIGVWSGFLALWAGLATPEQAARVVAEHYRNTKTFNAPFGVRSLSRLEKMYNLRGSGNPSSWMGPIWGAANYLTFRGLVKYGFADEARELAEKTVRLFGRDLERFGAMHEYYQPENGEPILNRGFQNWNCLVLNMSAWLEGRPVVEEF